MEMLKVATLLVVVTSALYIQSASSHGYTNEVMEQEIDEDNFEAEAEIEALEEEMANVMRVLENELAYINDNRKPKYSKTKRKTLQRANQVRKQPKKSEPINKPAPVTLTTRGPAPKKNFWTNPIRKKQIEEKKKLLAAKKKQQQVPKLYSCIKNGMNDPEIYNDNNLRKVAEKFMVENPESKLNDATCGEGITLHKLMKMIDSMRDAPPDKHIFHFLAGTASYAYLPKQGDCDGKTYKSNEGCPKCNPNGINYNKRNQKDSEIQLIKECTTATSYWSAWTPCWYCQWSLMDWKPTDRSVTIWFASFYEDTTSPPNKIKTTMEPCLQKMHNEGFKLKPWDWDQFIKDAQLTNDCKDVVNLVKHCREINTSLSAVTDVINKAKGNKYTGQCNRPPDMSSPTANTQFARWIRRMMQRYN